MLNKLLIPVLCLFPITTFAAESLDVQKAKSLLQNMMKDPDSTQFRNIKEVTNTVGEKSVCGEVNAKNSYGGYVGYRSFAYTNGDLTMEIPNDRWGLTRPKLELAGCSGVEAEKRQRKAIVVDNYCKTTYQFYVDIASNSLTREKAFELAKDNYNTQGFNIIKKDYSEYQLALEQGLQAMDSNSKLKKGYKNKDMVTRVEFLRACTQAYSN
ncbi:MULTISPECIES: hypothetical protein [Acinetobacter]|uniref:hypothetical protein n=1 Tax=Acinetobacter TaxID=469 RepID=UPI0002F98749|nr:MULTISPECIES: hypothetical protein [Acinetobacter]MCM5533177.1 hypothetical protein [Acinetobacter pittii]MCQ9383132.1 hypothetical protein [Acinetobacter pittii]MCR3926052.1 hypothetical protein [Acinetobacter pittii]NUF10358.1 hypothetical protein [Acinetobacter oleivorans]